MATSFENGLKNYPYNQRKKESWERFIANRSLLETNQEEAKSRQRAFIQDRLKKSGIKPGENFVYSYLPEDEDAEEENMSVEGDEFIELTKDNLIVHTHGDDVDFAISIETIIDIDANGGRL